MKKFLKFALFMILMVCTLPLISCEISDILGTEQVQEFNVVFMVDDNIYHSTTIKEGETIVIPENPTKEGYEFIGWYSDYELTTEYDFVTTILTGNVIVYAKFKEVSSDDSGIDQPKEVYYTVTFNVDGVKYDAQTVLENTKYTFPENPEKEGYEFKGWYNESVLVSEPGEVTSDIILEAKFEEVIPSTKIVKFDYTLIKNHVKFGLTVPENCDIYAWVWIDGGEGMFVPTHNGEIEVPYEYDRVLFVFMPTGFEPNWSTMYAQTIDLLIVDDYVVEGIYYTVEYYVNGNLQISDRVLEKYAARNYEIEVEDGYEFVGWYCGEELYDFNQLITGDLRLDAKIEEITNETKVVKFDYTLIRNNMRFDSTVPEDCDVYAWVWVDGKPEGMFVATYNGEFEVPYKFDRVVFIFMPVGLGPNWSMMYNQTIDLLIDNDTVVEGNCYTVEYYVNGNLQISDRVLEKYAARYYEIEVEDGYEFVGWYCGEELYDFNQPITSDLRLDARIELIELSDENITITFWHTMGNQIQSVLDEVIKEFTALYPNITIKHQQIGGYNDVFDMVINNVNDLPNMAYAYNEHAYIYDKLGLLVSLDKYANNGAYGFDGTKLLYDGVNEEDFVESFINQGVFDGTLKTLPFLRSSEALFYNKTFFEENNLKVPTTWEEMWDVCAQIKAIDPTSTPLGYDQEDNLFMTLAETYGCLSEDFDFDNPEINELMKMFKENYNKGYFTTMDLYGNYTNYLMTDINAPSRTYMCIGAIAGANYQINKDGAFETGVTGLPGAKNSNAKLTSQGPSLVMFDSTNEEELATWLFMQYLETPIVQAKFSLVSSYMPVTKSAIEIEAYQEFLNGGHIISLAIKQGLEQQEDYIVMNPKYNSVILDSINNYLVDLMRYNGSDYNEYINKEANELETNSLKYYETWLSENDNELENISRMIKYSLGLNVNIDVNKTYQVDKFISLNGKEYSVKISSENEFVRINEYDQGYELIFAKNFDSYKLATLLISVSDAYSEYSEDITVVIPQVYLTTHDEFISMPDNSYVGMKGVVTSIISKNNGNSYNSLFIQTEDGYGVYVYGLPSEAKELGIEKGMTIFVTGYKSTYGGMPEIISPSIEIIDSNIKEIEPIDITEVFVNAESVGDPKLLNMVGSLVTIKGVTIGDKLEGINGYYYFDYNGLQSYVRIYKANCPLTLQQQEELKMSHALHYGWSANVTGVVYSYNGVAHLLPVDLGAFEYISEPDLTDVDKVNIEINNIILEQVVFEQNATIALPLCGKLYNDVKITWSSNDEQVVVDNISGELYVTLGSESKNVELVAQLVYGEITEYTSFMLTLYNAESTTITYKPISGMPVENVSYKLGMAQNNENVNKTLYANGIVSNRFLETTEYVNEAVDFYVTIIDGGMYIYTKISDVTHYLYLYYNDANKISIGLTTENPTVWVMHPDLGVLTTYDGAYYLGTYSTFTTISASKISFINSDNKGITQFPLEFYAE